MCYNYNNGVYTTMLQRKRLTQRSANHTTLLSGRAPSSSHFLLLHTIWRNSSIPQKYSINSWKQSKTSKRRPQSLKLSKCKDPGKRVLRLRSFGGVENNRETICNEDDSEVKNKLVKLTSNKSDSFNQKALLPNKYPWNVPK